MNAPRILGIVCAAALVIASIAANAELFDRGNGLIYDSDQNLTWLRNANYASLELSDARVAEIISEVGSVAGHTLRSADQTISDFVRTNGIYTGEMSWWGAMAWAQALDYAGFSDWRLPVTEQFPEDDPTCSGDVRGTYFYEHRAGCTGGEMEYLTAFELYDAEDPAGGNPFANEPFINIVSSRYWSATQYRDWVDPCIYYPLYEVPCNLTNDSGKRTDFYWQWAFVGDAVPEPYKTTLKAGNKRFAWAVRDGDVIPSILPGDMNFDDQVNLADYLLLTQFVLGIRTDPLPEELSAGDMNQNNQLDAGDLVIHLQTVLGQI